MSFSRIRFGTRRWLSRARALAARILRHPTWVVERARVRLVRAPTRNAGRDLSSEIAAHAVDLSTLLARVGADMGSGTAPAPAPSWLPTPDDHDETEWTSRLTLLRLIYALVRVRKPQTMLEVGVERGFSTAVALHAMEENGVGEL